MDLCNHGRLDLNAALAAPSGSMMPLTDSRICRVLQTLKRWTRAFLVLCRRLQRLLEEVVAHEPFVAIVVTEKLRARCTRRRKNTRQGRMEREQTPMGECWHSHITNAHLQVLVSATHTHARTHTHTHTQHTEEETAPTSRPESDILSSIGGSKDRADDLHVLVHPAHPYLHAKHFHFKGHEPGFRVSGFGFRVSGTGH